MDILFKCKTLLSFTWTEIYGTRFTRNVILNVSLDRYQHNYVKIKLIPQDGVYYFYLYSKWKVWRTLSSVYCKYHEWMEINEEQLTKKKQYKWFFKYN